MKRSRVVIDAIIVLVLVFALIIICENILKDSNIVDLKNIIILLFACVSGASCYYYYSLSSNLSLYLSFGKTRKEIFKKSLLNGSIVLLILFILTIFSIISDMFFRKSDFDLNRIFVESKIAYLVLSFILFSILGNLTGIVSKNKYLSHSILIGLIVILFTVSLLFDYLIVNYIAIVVAILDIILFFIMKKKYYNHIFDL